MTNNLFLKYLVSRTKFSKPSDDDVVLSPKQDGIQTCWFWRAIKRVNECSPTSILPVEIRTKFSISARMRGKPLIYLQDLEVGSEFCVIFTTANDKTASLFENLLYRKK